MRSDRRAVVILATAFAVAYAAAFEATNWFEVYGLGWWDVKFHNRAGNIAFGHALLPVFTALAVLSHLGGSLPLRARLRHVGAGRLALGGAAAAVLSEGVWFAVAAAAHDLNEFSPWYHRAATANWLLLLAGPAAVTALAIGVTGRRPRDGPHAPAV